MTTSNPLANSGDTSAELASVKRTQREIASQLGEQQRQHYWLRAKHLWAGTRIASLKGIAGLRNVADHLLGWRLGMVVIYAAAILILSFFCEIVLGYGLPMLAIGLLVVAIIAILHYVPAGAILTAQIRRAEEERAKLAAALAEQQPVLRTLRQQKQGLDSQATFLQGETQRTSRQWQMRQQQIVQAQIVPPQPKVGSIPGPGLFDVDVVGESKYQRALDRICGGRTEDGVDCLVTAVLIYDSSNRYDKMAIRIEIDGETVGYLSRENAREYRKQMEIAGHPGLTASCEARIVGGWDRGPDDQGYFGVKLDLPTAL